MKKRFIFFAASAVLLAIALVTITVTAASGSTLVSSGYTWNYDDTGADLGAAWCEISYDDSGWSWGPAPLGYGGDPHIVTSLDYGGDASDKYPCYYFRHSFEVADSSAYEALTVRVLRDDGCVVYLNGTEVARSNMPSGEITYGTWASSAVGGGDETTWYEFSVDGALLMAGTNLIGVEVHQANASSTDVGFDLELVELVPELRKGPYLQMVTQNAMVIMWETNTAADSRVDYDGKFVEDSTSVTIHEMTLTGLTPDTAYQYTVTSGTATSESNTFATAPATERSFRFVAYGDTRTNYNDHAAVIQGIINSGPELVLHTGDLVENGDEYSQWGPQFFDPAYALMIDTPLLPVIGNHEGSGNLFRDFFSLGDNDDWFAFSYSNVRFIGLNTHNRSYSPGSTQYTWLEGELQSSECTSADWQIVYFHHPPYTATSSHSDEIGVQTHLVPLFEEHGVDMVFNGHSHVYERYFNNGIYYIVTGGGGAPLASLVGDDDPPISEYAESVYHHCVIDVDVANSSLTLSARYNDGVEFDTITIIKSNKATNPNPDDGAEDVDINTYLSWKAGIDAQTHDVYFGTDFDAVNKALDPDTLPGRGNQTETTYVLDTLANNTTYYWRIDEIDSEMTVHTGVVWSFTTAPVPGPASNPSPTGTDVGVDSDLSWAAGSDATSHDVYFGDDSQNLPRVSTGQSSTTYDPGTMNYETTYNWRIDEVGPGGVTEGTVWSFTTEAVPDDVDDTAAGESTVNGTVTTGSYANTQASDNSYEVIEEVIKSKNKNFIYSVLEHKWVFDVTGGNLITFHLEAHKSTSSDGDDFVFAYSTDDSTYTDMLTVTKMADDDTYQTYTLPGSTSGTVYIRVQDTDRTRGNAELDSIYVDHMFIRSSVIVAPPEQASNPSPTGTEVGVDSDLSWTAGAGTESHNVYFGTTDLLAFAGNQSGTTFDPGTLEPSTTYFWRVDELNSFGTTTGVVWSFITKISTGKVYVYDIEMSSKKAGKNYSGLATVWIKNDLGANVEGATVSGAWSGAVDSTASGVTGPDGKVILRSSNVKGGGTFTFTITDVVASGYTYDDSLNVETSGSIPVP